LSGRRKELRSTVFAFAGVFRLADDFLLFFRSDRRRIIGDRRELAFASIEVFVIFGLASGKTFSFRFSLRSRSYRALNVGEESHALHFRIVRHGRGLRLGIMSAKRSETKRMKRDEREDLRLTIGCSIVTFDVLHVQCQSTD
jgi:hypothetical protein